MNEIKHKPRRPTLSVRNGQKYVEITVLRGKPASKASIGRVASAFLSDYLSAKNARAARRVLQKHVQPLHLPIKTLPEAERRLALRVSRLLRLGVPPYPSERATVWAGEVRRVGRGAEAHFLNALSNGTDADQYAALIALRVLGCEAWAEGYDADLTYRVRNDNREVVIAPPRASGQIR